MESKESANLYTKINYLERDIRSQADIIKLNREHIQDLTTELVTAKHMIAELFLENELLREECNYLSETQVPKWKQAYMKSWAKEYINATKDKGDN